MGISPGILLVNYLKMQGTSKDSGNVGVGGRYQRGHYAPKWDGRNTQVIRTVEDCLSVVNMDTQGLQMQELEF